MQREGGEVGSLADAAGILGAEVGDVCFQIAVARGVNWGHSWLI